MSTFAQTLIICSIVVRVTSTLPYLPLMSGAYLDMLKVEFRLIKVSTSFVVTSTLPYLPHSSFVVTSTLPYLPHSSFVVTSGFNVLSTTRLRRVSTVYNFFLFLKNFTHLADNIISKRARFNRYI